MNLCPGPNLTCPSKVPTEGAWQDAGRASQGYHSLAWAVHINPCGPGMGSSEALLLEPLLLYPVPACWDTALLLSSASVLTPDP